MSALPPAPFQTLSSLIIAGIVRRVFMIISAGVNDFLNTRSSDIEIAMQFFFLVERWEITR